MTVGAAITFLIRYKNPVYPVYPCLNPSPLVGFADILLPRKNPAQHFPNFRGYRVLG